MRGKGTAAPLRGDALSGRVVLARLQGSRSIRLKGSRCGDTDRATPLVEDVEHVGVAEVDLHRTAARALAVVALEIPIDPRICNFQRNAPFRPRRHEIERRS